VVDLATSQPLTDGLEIDSDSDSELESSSGSHSAVEEQEPHQVKEIQKESDNVLPTPSDTESHSSSVIEVMPPEELPDKLFRTSLMEADALPIGTPNNDRRPGYKISKVSSDVSENLIVPTQRTRKPTH
jgi:hypothetical protein